MVVSAVRTACAFEVRSHIGLDMLRVIRFGGQRVPQAVGNHADDAQKSVL